MSVPPRPTCTAATVSLIFGILSFVLLPVLGAIVAIIAGHMARAEIRRSNGALDGESLATIGLVLGWVHLAIIVLAVLAFVLFFGGIAVLLAFLAHLH